MRRRSWLRVFVALIILTIIVVFAVDFWVKRSTREQLYSDIVSIPHNKVGLLLGTNKMAGGYENLYYRYRINAAVELFNAGKIDYILISGDNSRKDYSEPEDMQQSLIDAGIPAERIVLDYAGFRTLDSILRCLGVFGEDNITVISQRFHNERALFIANHKDIHAIGYNAQDVPKRWSYKVMLREKFARVKMLLDITFNKQPKFYGPKVEIDAEKHHEYPLKDFSFKNVFSGLRNNDSLNNYMVTSPSIMSYNNSLNTDSFFHEWIVKHPNAMVKIVVDVAAMETIGYAQKYCWLIAGRDTLNSFLVKKGCISAKSQCSINEWSDIVQPAVGGRQYKVYVDTLTFNRFTTQIKNAEAFAKQNKLGIWHE